MISLSLHEKTVERILKMRDEYVKIFPGEGPLSAMESDNDTLLYILFYGESMLKLRMEKKKRFGIAVCMEGPE